VTRIRRRLLLGSLVAAALALAALGVAIDAGRRVRTVLT
jgi:hypothetical protein